MTPTRDQLIDLILRETTDKVTADGVQIAAPNILEVGCRYVRGDPRRGYEKPADAARQFAGFIADAFLALAPRPGFSPFDVEDYVADYEFRADGDGGSYSPNENERALLIDAIHGALSELSLTTPARAETQDEGAEMTRLLKLADSALANVTAFEDDARYIMGNTNYAITENARSEIRSFLLAQSAKTSVRPKALEILDRLLDHSGARGSFDAMKHGDAVKDAEELLRSARSPGHTDLMVTPESIDAYMKDNPMEAHAADEDRVGEATDAKAVIRDEQIVISIDVDALPGILSGSIATNSVAGLFKVSDPIAFAKEVCGALNAENEDGTTRVHMMFDSAFNHAIDQGAEGVEEITEDEFEADAQRIQSEALAALKTEVRP